MNREHHLIKPQDDLEISEFNVSARDGHPVLIRSYRPSDKKADELIPLVIYLHGGFVTGGLETDDRSCRAVALRCGVVVLNVEYRLAPENKFPIGWQDSYDVVKWASQPPQEPKKNKAIKLTPEPSSSPGRFPRRAKATLRRPDQRLHPRRHLRRRKLHGRPLALLRRPRRPDRELREAVAPADGPDVHRAQRLPPLRAARAVRGPHPERRRDNRRPGADAEEHRLLCR